MQMNVTGTDLMAKNGSINIAGEFHFQTIIEVRKKREFSCGILIYCLRKQGRRRGVLTCASLAKQEE